MSNDRLYKNTNRDYNFINIYRCRRNANRDYNFINIYIDAEEIQTEITT